MIRTVLSCLLAGGSILLLLLLLLMGVLRFHLFSSEFYTTALREAKLYSIGRSYLLDSLTKQMGLAPTEETEVNLYKEVAAAVAADIFTESRLQQLIERNLVNLTSYLTGQDRELNLFLPLTEIRTIITGGELRTLLQGNLHNKITTLPPCTAAQEEVFAQGELDLAAFPNCQPQSMTTSELQLDRLATSQELQELEQRVVDEVSFLSLPDEMTLQQFVGATHNGDLDPVKVYQGLRPPRDGYRVSGWILWGLLIWVTVNLFLIWLLQRRSRNGLLRWMGAVLLITGLILLSGGLVSSHLEQKGITLLQENGSFTSGEGKELELLKEALLQAVDTAAQKLAGSVLLVGGASSVAGIGVVVAGTIGGRRADKVRKAEVV